MANGASRGTNHDMHFREFLEKTNGRDWVVVRNMVGLDYEQQKNYTLTITAMVNLIFSCKFEMIEKLTNVFNCGTFISRNNYIKILIIYCNSILMY